MYLEYLDRHTSANRVDLDETAPLEQFNLSTLIAFKPVLFTHQLIVK